MNDGKYYFLLNYSTILPGYLMVNRSAFIADLPFPCTLKAHCGHFWIHGEEKK